MRDKGITGMKLTARGRMFDSGQATSWRNVRQSAINSRLKQALAFFIKFPFLFSRVTFHFSEIFLPKP